MNGNEDLYSLRENVSQGLYCQYTRCTLANPLVVGIWLSGHVVGYTSMKLIYVQPDYY